MQHWKSVLVTPQASLETAISIIDGGGAQIALVVDEQRRLLGTLTDGDVRRALLKHIPLSATVTKAMHLAPTIAIQGTGREGMLALMKVRQLLQLPIVDDEGCVVGLETLQDLLSRKQLTNPVFLMAGGFGTRLYPLTKDCPKPLLKIGGKPILERIMESCINAGLGNFFISTHYMPEMIQDYFGDGGKWGVNIRYVYEETPLGTGGALGLLPHDEINEPTLMMNGDLLTSVNFASLFEFHSTHKGVATMCVREYQHQVPFGVITSDGHKIQAMVEKPTQSFFVNAGMYVLSPELVKSVRPGTRVDMPTLLEQSISHGGEVVAFPVHEYWLDIGRMDDFERAQKELDMGRAEFRVV